MNVKVKSKPPLESIAGLHEAIGVVETTLADLGRVLVRYSGTENLCRVMVEGPKQKQVVQLAESIASVIRAEIGLEGLIKE